MREDEYQKLNGITGGSPIAIIGLACRFPGNVTNPKDFWQLLRDGRDTRIRVPADRYNEESFLRSHQHIGGATNHRGGHFLTQDISAFDRKFFRLGSLEIESIDP